MGGEPVADTGFAYLECRSGRNMTRRLPKSSLTSLVLAVLSVALAFHLWHHFVDPDCDGGRHGAQPCATCAGLHSAVVAARTQPLPQPYRTAVEPISTLVSVVPAAAVVPGGAPRAPPAA